MKTVDVVVVKIYITEGSHLLNNIVNYLRKEVKIRGITVFRAISGYGETGEHTTSLVDLALDLPITVEFFDSKEKIEIALTHLSTLIKAEHIVFWDAKSNV